MKIFSRAAIACTLLFAAVSVMPATSAQAQGAPQIIIVDMQRIAAESSAAKNAEPQLKAKRDGVQQRAKTLGEQVRGEMASLQKAQPSMAQEAFVAKAKQLEEKRRAAEVEVRNREQDYARSVQYVRQQILQAVNPIITAIMREKGATVAMDRGVTLAVAQSLDVTNDVLARLNTALPRVGINPPAQPAAKK